jgi:hypothetical protein
MFVDGFNLWYNCLHNQKINEMTNPNQADLTLFEKNTNSTGGVVRSSMVMFAPTGNQSVRVNDVLIENAQIFDKNGNEVKLEDIQNPIAREIAVKIEDREGNYAQYYKGLNPRYNAIEKEANNDPFVNPVARKAEIQEEAIARLKEDTKGHRMDADAMTALDGSQVKSDIPFFDGRQIYDDED